MQVGMFLWGRLHNAAHSTGVSSQLLRGDKKKAHTQLQALSHTGPSRASQLTLRHSFGGGDPRVDRVQEANAAAASWPGPSAVAREAKVVVGG